MEQNCKQGIYRLLYASARGSAATAVVGILYQERIATLEQQVDLYKGRSEIGFSNENPTRIMALASISEKVTHIGSDNAITLDYEPIPDSILLIITTQSFSPLTSRGIDVVGREVYLEDIPGDIQLLTVAREYAPEGSVAIKYQRNLTVKDIQEAR